MAQAAPLYPLDTPRQSADRQALNAYVAASWGPYASWQDLLAKRLVEISGDGRCGAQISLAVAWVVAAQHAGETVVWIQGGQRSLYPPDLAACGVDLTSLVVVHLDLKVSGGLPRAAEILLRTGGIGLVVLDATAGGPLLPRSLAWQGRLAALAREHRSSVLVLTQKEEAEPSLGPLIALHVRATRRAVRPPGRAVDQPFNLRSAAPQAESSLCVQASKNKLGLLLPDASWPMALPVDLPCLV